MMRRLSTNRKGHLTGVSYLLVGITGIFSLFGCSKVQEGQLIFLQPEAGDPFNYPYYLFIPDQVTTDTAIYLIIEPNNSGITHDSLQPHIERAASTASKDFYIGNYVSRKLNIPLLVPAFPRPATDWHIYTHDLDRDVMLQKDNDLERIDQQLIGMFEDAQARLRERSINVKDEFLLAGFSASGSFTNRFTAIHPDRVAAAAAGGTGGLLILPLDSLYGERLMFPNGTGDLKAITGKAFQKEAFRKTPQYYFIGELDDNDAVPYDDAYSKEEREQIYRLFHKTDLLDRWKQCRSIYAEQGVAAQFNTYESVAHAHPEAIKKDILGFFVERLDNN